MQCLAGCDMGESWWSKRKTGYALTCWLLFSIPVFLLWNIPIIWLKIGRQSRNSDYSQQAQHSAHSGPWRDGIVYSNAIFHYWLCEQEPSLTCSINKDHVAYKAQSPLDLLTKKATKNSMLSCFQGSSPRTALFRDKVLCKHQMLSIYPPCK